MRRQITIGTRGSRLAMIQAESVLTALVSIHSTIEFSLSKIITTGDRHQIVPADLTPSPGMFVKELRQAVLDGRVDMAIHSLKDLPVQEHEGLMIAAVTKRLDPRDVLVSRCGKLSELSPDSRIGTGSPRRAAQLLAYRSDLKVQSIRGNIDTRLDKVSRGEVDGIIVAAAGLIRLGCENKITEYFPLEHFLPEPGQGTLAVEVRASDRELLELIQPLHHEPTWQSVAAERAFVQAMGGGCSTAIASLGTVDGTTLRLRGMVSGSGKLHYAQELGSVAAPEKVAEKLAQRLLAVGKQ